MRGDNQTGLRIIILERRCLKLTIATATLCIAWLVMLVYLVGFQPRSVQGDEPVKELKVHSLVILDEKGTERVRIGAPATASNEARESVWKVPVSGITLYDPDGKTRGGFVTTNSRPSQACLIVEAENHQPILFANPNDRVVCW